MAPGYTEITKPGNPNHTQLTVNQIAGEAMAVGWKGEDVITAVAIALAESGGWTDAYNDNPITKDLSFGLWQINMYGDLGPARRKQFGISENHQLFGSAINAKAAKMVYDGQGWAAWSVYKSGRYRAFLIPARLGAQSPTSPGTITAGNEGTRTEVDLLKPFKDLAEWLMKLLGPVVLRIAGFVGGGIIIIVAIVLYVRGQQK